MSDFDVHSDEMRFRPRHDDDLEEVAAFVEEVREVYGADPAPAPNQALASVLASGLTPRCGERRRTMRSGKLRTRQGKVAVALAAAFAAFGGFGVAGALPGTVQDTVSDAGTHLGLHLPSNDDDQGQNVDSQGTDVDQEIEAPEPTEAPEPPEVEDQDEGNAPEPAEVEVEDQDEGNAPEPAEVEVEDQDEGDAPEPAEVDHDDDKTSLPGSGSSDDESSDESHESSDD